MKKLKKQYKMKNKKEYLYGWLFTFNPATNNWRACTRDQYLDLFSKPEETFLRSENKEDLEALIMECEGNVDVKTAVKRLGKKLIKP